MFRRSRWRRSRGCTRTVSCRAASEGTGSAWLAQPAVRVQRQVRRRLRGELPSSSRQLHVDGWSLQKQRVAPIPRDEPNGVPRLYFNRGQDHVRQPTGEPQRDAVPTTRVPAAALWPLRLGLLVGQAPLARGGDRPEDQSERRPVLPVGASHRHRGPQARATRTPAPAPSSVMGVAARRGRNELWPKVGDGERRGWRIVGITNLPHLQRGVIRHNGEYRCSPSLSRGS